MRIDSNEVVAKYLTENLPTVRATIGASGETASFRCPFCLLTHTHGTGSGPGSRKSHCQLRPDPFGGRYFLEFDGSNREEELA